MHNKLHDSDPDECMLTSLQTARGQISPWSLALWWPYHLGLRTKLIIQRHTRTEPTWSSIAPGWCGTKTCSSTLGRCSLRMLCWSIQQCHNYSTRIALYPCVTWQRRGACVA